MMSGYADEVIPSWVGTSCADVTGLHNLAIIL